MSKLNIFPLGQKGGTQEYLNCLGMKQRFTSQPASSTATAGIFVQADGIEIETILVQNKSGGALTPGRVVTWNGANVGTQVGAVTGAAGVGCGVVDPWLNGTVGVDEVFHLVRKGKAKGTAGAAISAGAQVIPAATGKLVAMTADVAGVTARCGRITTAAGADGDVREFVFDFEV